MRITSKQMYFIQYSIGVFLIFCWRFELGEILTFLGSIIGVLGAYHIFDMGRKIDIQNKVNTFYEMVSYTVKMTEDYVDEYVLEISNFVISNCEKHGYLVDDVREFTILLAEDTLAVYRLLYTDFNKGKFPQFDKFMSFFVLDELEKEEKYVSSFLEKEIKSSSRFVYYTNWNDAITYISEEERFILIEWILYLQESKLENPLGDYRTEEFILKREEVVNLLNRKSKYKNRFLTIRQLVIDNLDVFNQLEQENESG